MGTYNDANPNGLDMTGWKTVFFDGFNGTQLDWTKWPITYGGSMYWNNAFWWDGGQNTVGNGELTIGMDKQSNGIWTVGGLSTMPYTGAPAGHGNTFTYGRVEIRAKTSVEVEGAGPCFLLWPSDNSWPPEVDILETPKGGNGMFTNHWRGPNGEDWYKPHYYDIDTSQWHTYTLDWMPDRLTLYVDGKKVAETTENIPNIPMSVGLQGHVGQEWDGWYGNPNDTNVSSVDISVDWVRVSQYDGSTPPTPTPTPTPAPGLTLNGTAGGDNLKGGAEGDTISGGAGADTLSGNGGNDVLSGGDGNDTLYGNTGNDALNGGAGNDALRGGAGDDNIATGTGTDRVLFGSGDGHDTVTDFQLGSDRVQLTNVTAADVTASVATVNGMSGLKLALANGDSLFLQGLGTATAKQLGISGSFASGGTTTPANPTYNTVNGTGGNDWLKGTAGNDSLLGGAGADDLQGLGGNDILRGGTGDDGLIGGAGNDIFVFARGDGHDWIEDFVMGADKVRLEGVSASEVTQTLETRWGYTGVALDFGTDEVFVAGATAKLGSTDLVFA